jgi:hypothetical protein
LLNRYGNLRVLEEIPSNETLLNLGCGFGWCQSSYVHVPNQHQGKIAGIRDTGVLFEIGRFKYLNV